MFFTILQNVALILCYVIIGFVLCKTKKMEVKHAKSFSALLLYVLCPVMIINAFAHLEKTNDTTTKVGMYFAVTLVVQLIWLSLIYFILRKKYKDAKYRILSIGSIHGNVGFFGLPIVAALFPDEPIAVVYSSINTLTLNLIVYTFGVYLITNDKKYVSLKNALLNPTTIGMAIALIIYFLNIKISEPVDGTMGILTKMVTPVCMVVLGMRLSASKLKKVFTRPFVYAACAMKMLAYPVFAFLCIKWLPFLDDVTKTTVIVLAAAPSGAIISSLAEMYECEQEFSANIVFVATILSIFTMPVITTILIH